MYGRCCSVRDPRLSETAGHTIAPRDGRIWNVGLTADKAALLCTGWIERPRMFLMGLGALLVLVGVVYMARATIWRDRLAGRLVTHWSRHAAALDFWDLAQTGRAFF